MREKRSHMHGMHFFWRRVFLSQSCDKHVLIDQKRCISEEDSALDSGGDGLGHLSLLMDAGRLCLEGDLTPWEGRSSPWDWSTYSL